MWSALGSHGIADDSEPLRAATLSETLPGVTHQLSVVPFEWLLQDALKASGKCPESCLLLAAAAGELARVFPAMTQFE
jgi:hypothetical protein